jgi:hypothetical protein
MVKKLSLILIVFILIPISDSFGSDSSIISPIKTGTIETNLLNIDFSTYTLASPNTSLVIAARDNNLYAAKRDSTVIEWYIKVGEKLAYIKDFNLPKDQEAKILILDIEPYLNKFLVSVVEYFDDPKKCSAMKLYESNNNENFISRFVSKPCVGGVDAWTEIAGRIAVNEKNNIAYITGGNILTDIYKNQFPRGGICCITGSYEDNMKNTNLFGSVVSINLKTNKSNKVSIGHRSPQGIEFDENKNIIYETEHGPRGGDELNIIKSNNNYGWPFVTLGKEYYPEFKILDAGFGKPVKTNTHKGYTDPLFSWMPSIAPSQLQLVRKNSNFFKYWSSDLIISTLKDNSIRRVHLSENGSKVLFDERIYIGERIRDIEPLDAGFILSTDNGSLIYISPSTIISGGGVFPPINK